METHRVHRLMFYNFEPKAIIGVSFSKVNNLVAVQRSDNRIEVWNVKAVPFIQYTILLKPQTKLKGIAWCKKRLFGADLEGFVKEFDLVSLREKNSYPVVSGGPCHCIAVSKSNKLLAVGTELGDINIFEIENQGLSFVKLIQTEKKRIVSICWSPNSDYILTGGVKAIRFYNYNESRLLHCMRPAKSKPRRNLIVWSIAIRSDLTVFAGDSEGNLSIWDGVKGICIDSVKSHPSDILIVCLSDDQNSVYCAGIDPDIKIYNRTKLKDGTIKWIKSRELVNHSHDVNSIIQFNNEWLCSGGVDSYLSVAKSSPFTVQLYPPLLQNPSVYVATESRYIMLRYSTYLELWHIKDISPDVLCLEPFMKLIEMRSIDNELIRCAAISKNGKFIFYATNTSARIFKFSFDEDSLRLQPLSFPDCRIENVYHASFSNDNQHFVISDNTSLIQVFSARSDESPELSLQYDISLPDNQKWSNNLINIVAVSYNGEFVAVAGSSGQIAVWKKNKFYGSLPKHQLPVTVVAFHPRRNIVCAVYSDFVYIEFSLDNLHYTEFSKSFDSSLLEKYLGKRNLPVTNIAFDYDIDDIIILHTSSMICVVDKNKVAITNHKKKKIKLDPDAEKSPYEKKIKRSLNIQQSGHFTLKSYFRNGEMALSENDLAEDSGFHVYEKYQHLVHFENFGSKEMIAVEIKPKKFLEKLPPLLKKNQFGRK